ncbi:thioesterase II family protein [Cellulomonas shaoxiangyii]|uniref:Thioesterase n=1 Tax=Cellulomonas shaoxiangyii TaxID=2566013 RepID=A0A4P7SN80_9CELL|nr:alpha/beta fold hydrolase [Cellulomonas shaoxiangyii]QCB94987.1 thioesterase [Cellulomonas shaoxiangyii]TGY85274.1 thioesterase [Cellulomonas shaoxiangyii]
MTPLRLYCLPYAGGSGRVFADWGPDLAPRVDVVPLELPGRGSRLREEPLDRLEPVVRDVVGSVLRDRVAHGPAPFAVLGYSYGAVLAFELARALEHAHGLRPEHLVVAAMRGPRWPGPVVQVAQLSPERFRHRLARLNGTPRELLDDLGFMALMEPVLRADFAVADSYLWRDGPGVGCPVTALGGTADRSVTAAALDAWAAATTGPFRRHLLPGDHFFLRPSREGLLRTLADALRVGGPVAEVSA